MAMLAEPKRKQKWCLNPRGVAWANDETKIGQKLLEKMGWSKGKGLGREEQGDRDHILVSAKHNTKGLGYKGKDDEWIKHYEGFENVLATLNSENNTAATSPCSSTPNSNMNSEDEDSRVVSLEARSKSSHARVHYHKFTRGKDLSRYNADDIACITGSKRSKQLAETAKKDQFLEDEIGNQQRTDGITTIKGGNIQEYFAKKMALLKGQKNQQQEDTLGVDNNTENVAQESKYFGLNSENVENPKAKKKSKKVKGTEDVEEEEHTQSWEEKIEKKKKTKKRKMMLEDSQLILETNRHTMEIVSDDAENSEDNQTHNIKEAKKKKKLVDEQENKDNFEINDKESSAEEPRKKKKKKAQENNDKETHYELEYSPSVEEPQKKKKKKVAYDTQKKDYETHNEQECIAEKPKKKKKKKKKKTKVEKTDDS